MASTSPDKILITGITGYIGFQTLAIALERGYSVRGVVRGEANISDLRSKSALIAKSQDEGQLDFAVVPDFLADGELAKTLDGITAIVHLAAPLAKPSDDLEATIIQPCIDMVTVVLDAAAQTPSVRRVVVTSSAVTLVPFEWNFAPDSDTVYTPTDINSNPKKPYSDAMDAYWASKALARIATRDYFTTDKKLHFDYVNLLPSVVIGPDDRLSAGNSKVADLLQGTRTAVMAPALDPSHNSPFPYVGCPVHVHDVARAHVDAVDATIVPGNTEYILSSNTPDGVTWDTHIAAIAKKYFSKEVESKTLPMEGSLTSIRWRLDTSKTEETFGWKMTTFEETMRGLIAQYLELKEAEPKA